MSIKWLTSLLTAGTVFLNISIAYSETPLETRIKKILAEGSLRADQTGVVVVSADRGKILASINADLPFNPASCAKIITSAAALTTLGQNYRFETIFSTDHREGESIGNLYISGNGDPTLVSEQMQQIISDLIGRGIKTITGDLILDDSFFDGPWYPRKNGDDGRAFTAPTSAVSLNFNSAKFVITPGTQVGKKTIVETDPPTTYVNIINKVTTGRKSFINIARKNGTEDQETFIVSGMIPPSAEPAEFYRNVNDPIRYAGFVFKDMLMQNGVAVRGTVHRGSPPPGSKELLREQSKPLLEIVKDMNKFSNNFIAEQITKHLGAIKEGKPGSTAKGTDVLGRYLSSIGIPPSDVVLENGSGLSATSRISASNLVKVLTTLYRNHALRSDFMESLSILGVDGTMRHWRSAPNLVGVLHAKTGSLDNVSALAGYIPMQNGETAAFAILANGFKRGRYSIHEAELKIASAITEGP